MVGVERNKKNGRSFRVVASYSAYCRLQSRRKNTRSTADPSLPIIYLGTLGSRKLPPLSVERAIAVIFWSSPSLYESRHLDTLNLNLPLHSLTAGCLAFWYYWDIVTSITNLQSGRFLVACTVTIVPLGFIIAAGRSTSDSSMEPRDQRDTSSPAGEQYRTRYKPNVSEVLGYPSNGGILMLPLDIAVAEYLGIPRLEVVYRDLDPINEDAFCNRLRLLGAKWWQSEDSYMLKLIGIEDMTEMEKREGIIVGWPGEGGVWILRTRADTAMLRMCVSMKERCSLLERWGAIFYEDPRGVEEFEGVFLERCT